MINPNQNALPPPPNVPAFEVVNGGMKKIFVWLIFLLEL